VIKSWIKTILRTYSFAEPLKDTMLMCVKNADTSLVSVQMLDLGEMFQQYTVVHAKTKDLNQVLNLLPGASNTREKTCVLKSSAC